MGSGLGLGLGDGAPARVQRAALCQRRCLRRWARTSRPRRPRAVGLRTVVGTRGWRGGGSCLCSDRTRLLATVRVSRGSHVRRFQGSLAENPALWSGYHLPRRNDPPRLPPPRALVAGTERDGTERDGTESTESRRHMRCCIMAALLTAVSAELQEVRHVARSSGEVTLEGCPDHVSWKDAPFANELEPDVPTYVYWLRALFTPKETTTIVRTRCLHPSAPRPTRPTPALFRSTFSAPRSPRPRSTTQRGACARPRAASIEQCPAVRRKFDCPDCMPCISLASLQADRADPDASRRSRARDMVPSCSRATPRPAAAAAAGGLFVKSSDAAAPSFVPMRAGAASSRCQVG